MLGARGSPTTRLRSPPEARSLCRMWLPGHLVVATCLGLRGILGAKSAGFRESRGRAAATAHLEGQATGESAKHAGPLGSADSGEGAGGNWPWQEKWTAHGSGLGRVAGVRVGKRRATRGGSWISKVREDQSPESGQRAGRGGKREWSVQKVRSRTGSERRQDGAPRARTSRGG